MEPFDNIVKAQGIFKKMMACEHPVAFKKVFSEAIYRNSLDDFYPVVVRAELCAALAFSHREKDRIPGFVFTDYLYKAFGLKPHHFVGLATQTVADIMESDFFVAEDMFRDFGYIVEDGVVTGHPELGDKPKVLDFSSARRKKTAGDV